ncbi:MAG: hypothetical protein ABIL02_01545 [candidate division WOR-3 bacterium]
MVIDRIPQNGQNCANQELACICVISDENSEVLKRGGIGAGVRRSIQLNYGRIRYYINFIKIVNLS